MKQIEGLAFVEDGNYQMHVAKPGKDDFEVLHLYEVTHIHKTRIMVLAGSEADAMSQADCIKGLEPGETPDYDATAKQVPFGIRGWSRRLF